MLWEFGRIIAANSEKALWKRQELFFSPTLDFEILKQRNGKNHKMKTDMPYSETEYLAIS